MRAVLLASVALAACSQAGAATRTFAVAGYDRVQNATPYDVRVRVGAPAGARADGSQEVLDRLELTVRNGQLTIGTKRGSWFSWSVTQGRVVIEVGAPRLAGAAVSGPGNMTVDRVRAPNFVAGVSGPGNLSIGTLETPDASLAVSGPGTLTVNGRANTANVAVSGPGNLRAQSFATRGATISLSGPGDIDLAVSETATVNLSGPGDVRIAGHPRCIVRKSGPGSVRCG